MSTESVVFSATAGKFVLEWLEVSARIGFGSGVPSSAKQSTKRALLPIVQQYQNRIKIMFDSGIRTGPDIARALACGAEFAFLGRTFMYAVAALGEAGGDHAMTMLKTQLRQVMEQVCCAKAADFPRHLVK